MKIFERQYDNPALADDTAKDNKYLGEFEIVETLFEDAYDSQRIGVKDGKVYLISEYEVSGYQNPFGGSRFEVKELTRLQLKGEQCKD